MEKAQKSQTDSQPAGAPCYVAITHDQHPLTGEAMPVIMRVYYHTTVSELIEWYKTLHHSTGVPYDLRITEAI